MVDPWPAYSGDKNIAFNGEKMQQAVARYRTGKEIQPEDPENFMSTNQTGQTVSTTVNTAGARRERRYRAPRPHASRHDRNVIDASGARA